jgi:DNA mismatch repair protein MutS
MQIQNHDTPVIKQWKNIKKSYLEEIIFYRLGDFYELFYEDAKNASRILNIQLTKRKNKNENIPMAGVPYHAANNYISKLLKLGYSVVICEQVGDSSESKGLMERRVERVLTPATVFEDEFLEDKKSNILLSLYFNLRENKAALSTLDISTGIFHALNVNINDLEQEIKSINPVEIITNSKYKDLEILNKFSNIKFLSWDVELSECYHSLLLHFETQHLHSFNIENENEIIRSAYNALIYSQDKIGNELKYINKIELVEKNNILYLDPNTKNNLDINNLNKKNNLFSFLDDCSTIMGSRKLYQWIDKPLNNLELILERQESIEILINNNNLQNILNDIGDVERIISRIALQSSKPKDLLNLKIFLEKLPLIKQELKQYNNKILLNKINDNIKDLKEISELIDNSIVDSPSNSFKEGNIIKEGYDSELDELKNINKSISLELLQMEEKEKNLLNIDKLKIAYNNIAGYYIEISNKEKNIVVPDYYIRKQSLTNCERYYTEELRLIENKVLSSKSKSILREKNLYIELLVIINNFHNDLRITANSIAELDVLNNLSNTIEKYNLTKPNFVDDYLEIKNGRHILIENLLDNQFTPNSLYMNNEKNNFIITGANMGGKSTYMRQNALIIILAQIGSFVPAEECNIKIFNKIFTRIGASDNISEGLSTFMVEMTETANILNHSDSNTFILLDEIGRGTSTYEGASIAWSVLNKIATDLHSFCLFATHYFEITELSKKHSNIENIFLESKINNEGKLEFSHKVKKGISNKSYGIEVAQLAGVPKDVVLEARLKLKNLESKKSLNKNTATVDFIEEIDLDAINPRQALDLLYKIKDNIKK